MKNKKINYIGAFLDGYFAETNFDYGYEYFDQFIIAEKLAKKSYKRFKKQFKKEKYENSNARII